MDKFRKDLQADAKRIDATVDDGLRQRLDARLQVAERTPRKQPASSRLLGWASVAAGLFAALLFLFLSDPAPAPGPAVPVASTEEPPLPIDLQVETADLTRPLQRELTNLQADVLMARETIERELGKNF